jgi:hypothetical protein
MRRTLLFAAICVICSCGGGSSSPRKDAGADAPKTDGGGDVPQSNQDSGAVDGGVDVATEGPDGGTKLTSCLDMPTDLPRPPSGGLPCELIPPGLAL